MNSSPPQINTLAEHFRQVRNNSLKIVAPLKIEDYVVQPVVDVSPPKWHLAHSTWFFEQFLLIPFLPDYAPFNPHFTFLFNSYYESVGERTLRTQRGHASRPTVAEVLNYRHYVDEHMHKLFHHSAFGSNQEIFKRTELGIQHEEQHQELLLTDIKFILHQPPLFPVYDVHSATDKLAAPKAASAFVSIPAGVYQIGYKGNDFCFDNELQAHEVLLRPFEIATELVSNQEYLTFMEAGGYETFKYWLSEGWTWLKQNQISHPLYWHKIEGKFCHFTLNGLQELAPEMPVTHLSFYEAHAFAQWKKMRLPTEMEWEVASPKFNYGYRWEWTHSAYLPYPGFKTAEGALGEYNGKFMSGQMVLRGGSVVSPKGHVRPTYRNFFHPYLQWQYTGVRLVNDH